jgi:hypothetical protein
MGWHPAGIFAVYVLKLRLMKAFLTIILMTTVGLTHGQISKSYYSSSRNGKDNYVYKTSNGISSFNIETRGKFELTDNDQDIKSMSNDGYLEITKVVFGSRRSIIISPEGNSLKREYYEGRSKVPFEPDGRRWLSEVLPEVVRSTTIGAESRVNRFYRKGGTTAVLNETNQMESDHVKAHYANLLMGLPVSSKEYASVISQISGALDSDHYLTEFLQKNIEKFLSDKEATTAVFNATRKMDSDHYKTEVIKEALNSSPATLENVRIIMRATSDMDSDHYKTEVITNLLRQNNLTDGIVAEMIDASKSVDSDHYRTVILTKALNKPGLSANSYQRAMESVRDIDSDHYKTEVLKSLIRNPMSEEAQLNLMSMITSIDSDHYMNVIASEMVERQNLSDASFQKLLEAMGSNGSDHYITVFLQNAMERPNLTKPNVQVILQVVGRIDSDHYKTEVLTDVASHIKALNDASLKEAYRAAAKGIDSETYYGRAMRAID